MSTTQSALPLYVNPQHTDKLYDDHQVEQCYSVPLPANGMPLPFLTTPTSDTAGLTFDLSDNSADMSEYSSASSIGSSPGCLTPSPSNASSRRHSLMVPESQQCVWSSKAHTQTSPTPRPRNTSSRHKVEQDHSPLIGTFSSFSEPLCSASNSVEGERLHSSMGSHGLLFDINMYQSKPNNIDWCYPGGVNNHMSAFDPGTHVNLPCLSVDLAAEFNASITNHVDLTEELIENPSLTALQSGLSQGQGTFISQVEHANTHTLAEPFEQSFDQSRRSSRSLGPRLACSRKHRGHLDGSSVRRKKASQKRETKWGHIRVYPSNNDNNHKCGQCGVLFIRPEHLKRHERKHLPREQTNLLLCLVPECDKKIKDRADNMRAHIHGTHFKYGKSAKGNNKRYSMKQSVEMNLKSEDPRWAQLLEGRIKIGDNETGYWKMLGYSIKETQEIKVKELIPEWEGAKEATLKDFDPRWKKLLQGSMTFEEAMERGHGMREEEKEGLLGIDMMTSKAMELDRYDPRWKRLLDGTMSIEISEKLGVRHLNPTAPEQRA